MSMFLRVLLSCDFYFVSFSIKSHRTELQQKLVSFLDINFQISPIYKHEFWMAFSYSFSSMYFSKEASFPMNLIYCLL